MTLRGIFAVNWITFSRIGKKGFKSSMDTSRFDFEDLIDRVGGDRDFALELFGDWVKGLGMELANLESTIQSGDVPALCFQAHTLKGAALNLAASAFASSAHQVEEAAIDGDLEAAARQVPAMKIEAEYLRTLSAQLLNTE